MPSPETPIIDDAYRAGEGEPLVLLHGILGTWHIWRPVLERLSDHHDVYAPTLPGHFQGPLLREGAEVSLSAIADGVEAALDRAGIDTAHIAGNSLGGWLSLELGRRGRARSVVALSPAGGWSSARKLKRVVRLLTFSTDALRYGSTRGLNDLLRRPGFRHMALANMMCHGERIAAADAVQMVQGTLECAAFGGFAAWVRGTASMLPADQPQDYPIRIAWGEVDKVIPFEGYGRPLCDAIPEAELVMIPGVGHVPMYDDPERIASTILEVTQPAPSRSGSEPKRSPASMPSQTLSIPGVRGSLAVRRWDATDPARIVVLAHGIGEHAGRYEHVAAALTAGGSVVYAPDHHGHGVSDGEPGLVSSIEQIVDDIHRVVDLAVSEHPGLPVVLIGHSLGGMIVTRAIQRGERRYAAAVLSAPAIGGNPAFEALMGMDPLPDVPIDPAILSRDPEVGRAYQEDPLVYHGPLQRQSLETIFTTVDAIKAGPGFGSLPVLWLQGTDDQLAPLAQNRVIIDQLRGDVFEEQIYEGAQHEVFNETNRDEVIAAAVDFLSRQVSPAVTAS